MLGRSKLFIAIFIATTVLPFVLSSTKGISGFTSRLWPAKGDSPAREATATPVAPVSAEAHAAKMQEIKKISPATGAPSVRTMEEVLRFDMNPSWVLGNWPRVSTDLAETSLQGYRVPCVTGTTEADLAGSLTYYFDTQKKLQRITFFGTTGDARRLVTLLESRFQFKNMVAPEPNVYLYQVKSWSSKVTSEMRIRPATVVRSNDPRARFEVALLIERPSSM